MPVSVLTLDSAVTFETIVSWQNALKKALFSARDRLIIEFAPGVVFDSAVFPLLLEALRSSAQKNCVCEFKEIPEALMSLARVYGLSQLLIEKSKV